MYNRKLKKPTTAEFSIADFFSGSLDVDFFARYNAAEEMNQKFLRTSYFPGMSFEDYIPISTDLLNQECRKIVDFGIGIGLPIMSFKQKGWDIVGYDYSITAVDHLRKNGINPHVVDLNSINPSSRQLSYQARIKMDLQEAANIFSLNTLQYLKNPAMCLLLFDFMNFAQPDSVFVFISRGYDVQEGLTRKEEIRQEKSQRELNNRGLLKGYYLSSFFGGRTDMECLLYRRSKTQDTKKEKPTRPLPDGKYFDETLVIRKRHC